jgi:hypothetical protein
LEYLCFLDESDSGGKVPDPFFVYGALLVPAVYVRGLHETVTFVREQARIPPDVPLKWNMPAIGGVPQSALDDAKAAAIEAAQRSRCEMFVSVVHRRIALKKQRGGEAHKFGANSVLPPPIGRTLGERNATAVFLFDRFPNMRADEAFEYLRHRMARGLGRLDDDPSMPLAAGFGFVSCDSTRIASALDVGLGAFTRCLNEKDPDTLARIGPPVMGMIARDPSGGVWERGLVVRPWDKIRVPQFVTSYVRMLERLRALGLPGLSAVRLVPGETPGSNRIVV